MKYLREGKIIPKIVSMSLALTSIISMGIGANALTPNVETYEGATRVETSIKTADKMNSDTVVLASGYSFADALSSYNIVKSRNAKLYLIDKNTDVKSILTKNKTKTVYIIGGDNTVSKDIENKVRSVVSNVKRVAGSDRYKTNKATIDIAGFNSVGVADGRNFPDALSASPLLKDKNLGLMLVNGSKSYKTNKRVVYTFGAKDSVRQDGGKRLSGSDRYATNLAIMKELGTPKSVVITDGRDFPDALSTVNLIAIGDKAAMIITGNTLNANQKDYINKVEKRVIVGGKLNASTKDFIHGKAVSPIKPDNNKPKDPKTDTKPVDNKDKNPVTPSNPKDNNTIPGNSDNTKPNTDNTGTNTGGSNNESTPVAPSEPTKPEEPKLSNEERTKIEFDKLNINTPLTNDEKELARLINEYRREKGLPELPISKSLTFVARAHVIDSNINNPQDMVINGRQGDMHSWSLQPMWTGGAFMDDLETAKIAWIKPYELTKMTYNKKPVYGYEIATYTNATNVSSIRMTPNRALNNWKKSPHHNAMMISENEWKDISSMGVGIEGNYAFVWFAEKPDNNGYFDLN